MVSIYSSFVFQYWRPFGNLLTQMERNGIKVDKEKLRESEIRAKSDREKVLLVC
jgi:hypothetical protein